MAAIFERIGTTAETWQARLEKLSKGHLRGRFFAASRKLVIGALVMHGEAPQQREGRALVELVAPTGPLRDLAPGVQRAIEQGEDAVSQIAQLSKSRHQRSIWEAVTRADSSTKYANIRASYQPVSQSAAASS